MKKLLLLAMAIGLLSCQKTEAVKTDGVQQTNASSGERNMMDNYGVSDTMDTTNFQEYIDSQTNDYNSSPSFSEQVVYNIVVFETKSHYGGAESNLVTGIFESEGYLTEDQKYKALDKAQKENKYSFGGRDILNRYLKSYNSYSEASRAREKYLGISSSGQNSSYEIVTDTLWVNEDSVTKHIHENSICEKAYVLLIEK